MNRTMDETSEALIAAAHRLLGEIGPEALTVRRIATEANMSTMNVYSRFGGKDGVIDALYIDGYRRLSEAIQQVPTTDDVPADLARVASVFRTWALDNPAYYGVMFRNKVPGFEPSPAAVDVAYTALVHLVERVRLGQERGDITTADDRDPTEIAAWLWATCHGMISLELDGTAEEFVSWSSIFDMGFRTALAGLHPSVAPASIG
jgi:AcrR family transcriptional regulator